GSERRRGGKGRRLGRGRHLRAARLRDQPYDDGSREPQPSRRFDRLAHDGPPERGSHGSCCGRTCSPRAAVKTAERAEEKALEARDLADLAAPRAPSRGEVPLPFPSSICVPCAPRALAVFSSLPAASSCL